MDKSMGDGVDAAPSLGEASIGLEALPRMGVNVLTCVWLEAVRE